MSSEIEESDSERSAFLYDHHLHPTTSKTPPLTQQVEVARRDHSKSRWDRLSDKYNDQYLEVFNAAWIPTDPDQYLETSQVGAVIWTGEEKARLFEALDRKGRHDLPALANIVETKSPAEVRDYILRLEEARDDRQKFSRNIKSVTQPDIEAAIEIGPDLEDRLEENANALAALQDHYNYSEARSRDRHLWLIDTELANSLSELEGSLGDTEESDTNVDSFILNFFKFDTMLELSRALFMNMADESEHDHWFDCAEPDEEPSLTLEAARDLYRLIKSLIMKILQTAIFLAESRLRSTSTAEYAPARALKDRDVSAAVEVLNMTSNSHDYWYKFLERSGLKIVVGSHRKGRQKASVTLEQARLLLNSKRGHEDHISLSNVLESSPPQSSRSEAVDSEDLTGSSEELSDINTDNDRSETSASETEDQEPPRNTQSETLTGHAAWRKRRALIEAAENDFMNSQDHQASITECQSLRASLNLPESELDVKSEDLRRPKKLRKLKEDLDDWAYVVYIAPWEEAKITDHDNADEIGETPSRAS